MLSKCAETFIGCDKSYKEADAVLFGAPFDSTTSYRPGARFASKSIRAESYAIESYSPYQDKSMDDINVFDGGDMELSIGDTTIVLGQVKGYVEKLLQDNKQPVMIGGEHLITLPAVSAICKRHPDLHIIQFDAHADLRDDYLGVKLSHATVMRRIWELLGDGKIFQYGIRSGDKEEFLWGKGHVYTQKFNFDGLDDVARQLKGKPVYFTLDLDVLDPSVLPGTGTPEPGGVGFIELLNAIKELQQLNIVGYDMVELSPTYDISGASTAVACKLLREMLLLFGKH